MNLEAALNRLAPKLCPGGTGVTDLRRLSGGASQETWAFIVHGAAGPRALILRRRPDGAAGVSNAVPLATEARLIQDTGARGAPVPPIVHVCTEADEIGEAYIMGRVEGETLGGRIVRGEAFAEVRPKLARQCGEVLAIIHATPLEGLPELSTTYALDEIERYETLYRSLDAKRPILEAAFRWLKDAAPAPVPAKLLHGDFRNGNLMFDPKTGLAAVLDWELAHLGDPASDMGWVCTNSWRFGGSGPVGGFGEYAEMLEAYEAAGGEAIALERVLYWQTLGSLKWGCMCMGMYSSFATGADPSVERAMIGRRTSETEIDLIALLEAAA